ncbi:hypothetical protein AAMO2058_000806700 [Amorphochlora amoebiformis]
MADDPAPLAGEVLIFDESPLGQYLDSLQAQATSISSERYREMPRKDRKGDGAERKNRSTSTGTSFLTFGEKVKAIGISLTGYIEDITRAGEELCIQAVDVYRKPIGRLSQELSLLMRSSNDPERILQIKQDINRRWLALATMSILLFIVLTAATALIISRGPVLGWEVTVFLVGIPGLIGLGGLEMSWAVVADLKEWEEWTLVFDSLIELRKIWKQLETRGRSGIHRLQELNLVSKGYHVRGGRVGEADDFRRFCAGKFRREYTGLMKYLCKEIDDLPEPNSPKDNKSANINSLRRWHKITSLRCKAYLTRETRKIIHCLRPSSSRPLLPWGSRKSRGKPQAHLQRISELSETSRKVLDWVTVTVGKSPGIGQGKRMKKAPVNLPEGKKEERKKRESEKCMEILEGHSRSILARLNLNRHRKNPHVDEEIEDLTYIQGILESARDSVKMVQTALRARKKAMEPKKSREILEEKKKELGSKKSAPRPFRPPEGVDLKAALLERLRETEKLPAKSGILEAVGEASSDDEEEDSKETKGVKGRLAGLGIDARSEEDDFETSLQLLTELRSVLRHRTGPKAEGSLS